MIAFRFLKLNYSLLFALLVSVSNLAQAQSDASYTKLVVLGDSLSDTGNHPAAILGLPFPYYQNRISNGPVAVDVLAEKLGLSAAHSGFLFDNGSGENYAVSGANAAGNEAHDLQNQLSALINDQGFNLDAKAIYVLMIGGNDIRDASAMRDEAQGLLAAQLAADAIKNTLQQLIAYGAKQILVSNVPNVSRIPETADREANNVGVMARAQRLSLAFNARLQGYVEDAAQTTGIKIIFYDFYAQFEQLFTQPAQLGFSNTTQACFEFSPYQFHPQCDFDAFVFFDSIHPSAKAHRLIGDGMATALISADAKPPTTAPALPAIMLLLSE